MGTTKDCAREAAGSKGKEWEKDEATDPETHGESTKRIRELPKGYSTGNCWAELTGNFTKVGRTQVDAQFPH